MLQLLHCRSPGLALLGFCSELQCEGEARSCHCFLICVCACMELSSNPLLFFFSLSFYFLAFAFPSPFCSPISPTELAALLSLPNHTDSTGWDFRVVFSAQNGEVGRRRDA